MKMIRPKIRNFHHCFATVHQFRRASTFLYPDLSTNETDFVQEQIDLVLNPACVQNSTSVHEDIFPPKSRKFLRERIFPVQKHFKDFKIPKSDNELYIRNITSVPKLERTILALKWAKADRSMLTSNPKMILLPPHEFARLAKISECFEDFDLSEAERLHLKRSIHGLFAIKHIKNTAQSLNVLGFPGASFKIKKINYARYNSLRYVRIIS